MVMLILFYKTNLSLIPTPNTEQQEQKSYRSNSLSNRGTHFLNKLLTNGTAVHQKNAIQPRSLFQECVNDSKPGNLSL